MANKLMFEVGIKRAEGEYQKIYDEVMKLAAMGGKGIDLKVNFQSTKDLQTFVEALRMVGDGKLLDPLLHKIEQLQVSMIRLGMVPKDINYDALAEQLNKITKAYENYQKEVAKSGESSAIAKQFYSAWQTQLGKLQNDFGLTENQARASLDTFKNLGNTVATSIERIGGSKAGMETLAGEISGVKGQVDSLVNSFKSFVDQLSKLATTNGVKEVNNDLTNVDKTTAKAAKTLGDTLDKLAKSKEIASGGESALAESSRTATGALMAEEDQAKRTASAMQEAALAIQAAALAATRLASVMGGNNADVNKFLELSSKMDVINRQASALLSNSAIPFGEKKTLMDGFKQELETITNEMNKLKQETSVGNPLIDAFTKAIEKLNTALTSASVSFVGFDKNVGTVAEKAGNAATQVNAKAEAIKKEGDAASKAASDLETLHKKENESNANLFNQQQFTSLQEAIDKIISEINRLQQAFTKLGENNSLSNLSTTINGLSVTLSTLSNAVKIDADSTLMKKLVADAEAAEKKIQELQAQIEKLQDKASRKTSKSVLDAAETANEGKTEKVTNTMERYLKLLVDVENQMAKIGKIQVISNQFGIDPEIVMQAYRGFEALKNLVDNIRQGKPIKLIEDGKEIEKVIPATSDYLSKLLAQFGLLKSSYKDIVSEADKYNKAQEKVFKKAATTAENLGNHIDKLSAKKINFSGMDTSALDTAINRIRLIKTELENFAKTGYSSYGKSANEIIQTLGLADANEQAKIALQNLNREKREGARASKQLETATSSAAAATTHLTEAEKNLAQAVKGSSDQMKGQSQILSDLKMMAMQYLSVWGAQSFLNNIIEIGGQLEMQRMSIGAILGDTAHANDLFEKIKALALQSPFGVVELDQMTKQLSAYGFEYNELYDMTKRLADISAATGTGVDRLSLALGHVRSEAALSGYTLRQFSMANIPLAKKLSEYYSEIEKRTVSVAEIRKRVSKKEIGYEDVVRVLKDLTDEGGMFYNMQETISKSVKAKFKNLKDAFSIMYGEIAESSVGDALKGLAGTLTELTRHWRELGAIILAVGSYWGINRLAMMAANKQIAVGNIATGQFTAKQLEAQAASGRLTKQLLLRAAATKKVAVADLEAAAGMLGLTKAQLQYARRTGDVAKAMNMATLATSRYTVSQLRLIATFRGASWSSAVKYTSMLRVGLMGAQQAAAGLAMTLKGLIFNPTTALLAGVGVMVDLWQRSREEAEKAKQINDDVFNRAQEGIKNIRQMFGDTDIKLTLNGKDVTAQFGEIEGKLKASHLSAKDLDTSGMMAYMDKWEKFIQEYSAMPNHLLNDAYKDEAGNVRNLADMYEKLYEKVLIVANAYDYLKDVASATEYAENMTNGYFDESLSTNMNDYAKAVKKYNDSISALYQNHRQSISVALKAARSESAFASAVREANAELIKENKPIMTEVDQLKMLVENQDKYTDAIKKFEDTAKKFSMDDFADLNTLFHGAGFWGGGMFGFDGPDRFAAEMKSAQQTMEADLDQWVASMKEKMSELGWDFGKLTESQKEALAQAIAEMVAKVGAGTEDIRKELKDLALTKFGIKIDDNTAEVAARIAGLKNSLRDLIYGDDKTKEWHIKVGTNFTETYDNIKKEYKAAQEFFKNSKPLMMKFGLQMTGDMKTLGLVKRTQMIKEWQGKNQGKDSSFFESFLADYDDYVTKLNEALGFQKATGLSLKDDKSKGKGKSEDREAKRIREIVKLYKDAYDWYNKYEKQIGEESALKKVQSQFKPLFDEFKEQFKQSLSLDSIPLYKENLEAILQEAEKLYKDPKHKNSYMVEAIKQIRDAINNVDFEELGRDQEEFLSKTQIQIDNLTRSWDTFNSVREATGNIELAIQLSGADYSYGKTRNLADAIKEKIQDDFYAAGAVEIPFDINLSDKEIEEKIKKAMPKASETRIKGFVEEYKKWRDLQRDVLRNDIQTFSKILGSAVDYETQLRKINDELRKQIEANNKVAESNPAMQSEVDKANDIVYVQSVEKAWKATEAYAALYNSSLSMSRDELQNGINVATAILQEKMRLNLITAHEYAQEMEKIRKIMQDFDTNGLFGKDNGLTSYLKGGLQGLSVYYDRMIERYTRLGEQAKKDGRYEDWAQYMNTAANYEQAQKKLANFTSGIADATLVVDMAKGVLDGFQKAAQSLSNMFDALGKSGAAEQWSDIADTIGAITSTLNGGSSVLQNAMNGNIGGTISSVLSAPVETITSPITAFAQLHDKKRERQIEDLKREVSKIDNTLNLIKSLRERELGYDSGNLRRQLAAQYQQQVQTIKMFGREIQLNTPQNAMYEYYSRGGLEGNGYQQELEALKKQREMYQEMYETEEDKKKSSSEALEEYKQKMAELDITIMNYAKDLANELWGIDLKGWADQIGDSLMTAFENGEDAAEAFKDTVQDIMRQVLRKMLTLGIIEPMMERLQKKLFGENGQGGIFDVNNPEGTIDAAMREVGAFFGDGGEGQQMIEATQSFYNKWEEFMRSKGLTLDESESSNSKASSIKSITEQTADLLASYIDAIRADVSVDRAMIAQYFPMFYSALTSGSTHLANIDNHTAAIMRSNDTIAAKITSLDNNINGLKNKAWKVPMA